MIYWALWSSILPYSQPWAAPYRNSLYSKLQPVTSHGSDSTVCESSGAHQPYPASSILSPSSSCPRCNIPTPIFPNLSNTKYSYFPLIPKAQANSPQSITRSVRPAKPQLPTSIYFREYPCCPPLVEPLVAPAVLLQLSLRFDCMGLLSCSLTAQRSSSERRPWLREAPLLRATHSLHRSPNLETVLRHPIEP